VYVKKYNHLKMMEFNLTLSHVTNLVKKDSMTGICFPTDMEKEIQWE
jgi:hypothetical protein